MFSSTFFAWFAQNMDFREGGPKEKFVKEHIVR